MEAVRNLEDVAIVIRPEKDNVAVVTVDFLEKGNTLNYRGESLTISGRVLRGQSFAIKKVGEGEPYVTLGDPIGLASRSVDSGDPTSESNLEDRLPKLAVRYRDNPGRPEADPALAGLTFDGFARRRSRRRAKLRRRGDVRDVLLDRGARDRGPRHARDLFAREVSQRRRRGPHFPGIRVRHAGRARR